MFIKYEFSETEIEDIKIAMRVEKNTTVKEHLQAVYMTMQNLKRNEVAKSLNKETEFVGKWVKTYKKSGTDKLTTPLNPLLYRIFELKIYFKISN